MSGLAIELICLEDGELVYLEMDADEFAAMEATVAALEADREACRQEAREREQRESQYDRD